MQDLVYVAGLAALAVLSITTLLSRSRLAPQGPAVQFVLAGASVIGLAAAGLGLSNFAFSSLSAPRPAPAEIQRLNQEFNALLARCAEHTARAGLDRQTALNTVPAARAVFDQHEALLRQGRSTASASERESLRAREDAENQAAQARATEEQAADAAAAENNAEAKHQAARRDADNTYARLMAELGRSIPPRPVESLEYERRKALQARDLAYERANDAHTASAQAGRDAQAAAYRAAYARYITATQTAWDQYERRRVVIARTLEDALHAANDALAATLSTHPVALGIQREHTSALQAIEQGCEEQKQIIYRKLRGEG